MNTDFEINHCIFHCYFHCASNSFCFCCYHFKLTLLSRLQLFVIWVYPERTMMHQGKIPKYGEKKLKSSLKPYKSHGLYLRIIEPNWKGFMKHWSSSLTRSSSFDCDFKSLIVITSLLKTFFTKRFKASRLVLLEYILI